MGPPRHAARSTARPAHLLGLHLRRHLPGRRQGRRPRAAAMHHRRHGPASGRDLPGRGARRPRRPPARSGRLAHLSQARRAQKHHPAAAPGKVTRTQPSREYLAVHARKLALQSNLHLLPRYPRPLLLRLEPPHRSALAYNIHRPARVGPSVMIRESWYKPIVILFMADGSSRLWSPSTTTLWHIDAGHSGRPPHQVRLITCISRHSSTLAGIHHSSPRTVVTYSGQR